MKLLKTMYRQFVRGRLPWIATCRKKTVRSVLPVLSLLFWSWWCFGTWRHPKIAAFSLFFTTNSIMYCSSWVLAADEKHTGKHGSQSATCNWHVQTMSSNLDISLLLKRAVIHLLSILAAKTKAHNFVVCTSLWHFWI